MMRTATQRCNRKLISTNSGAESRISNSAEQVILLSTAAPIQAYLEILPVPSLGLHIEQVFAEKYSFLRSGCVPT